MCVLVFDIELMFILLLLKLFKLWYNYVTVQEDCYIGDLGQSCCCWCCCCSSFAAAGAAAAAAAPVAAAGAAAAAPVAAAGAPAAAAPVQEDCYIGDLDCVAAAAPVAVSAPAGSAGGVLLQLPLLLRKRRYTLL